MPFRPCHPKWGCSVSKPQRGYLVAIEFFEFNTSEGDTAVLALELNIERDGRAGSTQFEVPEFPLQGFHTGSLRANGSKRSALRYLRRWVVSSGNLRTLSSDR